MACETLRTPSPGHIPLHPIQELVVYFGGDQIHCRGASETVLRLQTQDGVVEALLAAEPAEPASVLM